MATSGVFDGSTDHTYVDVEIRWSLNWADQDSNQGALNASLWARRTNVGWQTSGTFGGTIYIDGTAFPVSTYLTLGPGSEWQKIAEANKQFSYNADGTRSVGIAVSGSTPGTGWNTTSGSGTAVLDRIYAFPNPPSSMSATRSSDTSIAVAIAFPADNPRGPVWSTQINRRKMTAPGTWGPWSKIADLAGKVTSYTDTGVAANGNYQYSASAWNVRGYTSLVYSGEVQTTPAAPTGVTATKAADLSITTSWSNGATYTPASYRILDNGALLTTVGGTVETYRHGAPAANVAHTYTIQAVSANGLISAGAASPAVQLLTAPLAPTIVSPNGASQQVGNVTFSWRHNPVDTTPQAAYAMRYRKAGTTTWTTVTGTTGASRTLSLAAGGWEWQVQTKGSADSYSPWSATGTVTLITVPTVTVTSPANGSSLSASTISATWTWSQAEGRPQSAWEAVLMLSSGVELERKSGSGAATSVSFSTRLSNATSYRVLVAAATGPVSSSGQTTFSTSFLPPAAPTLSVAWDEDMGVVVASMARGSGSGVSPTTSLQLERSVDGGDTWEEVATTTAVSTSTSDGECLSNGRTDYRLTAWSALPSSTSVTAFATAASKKVWLGGGPGHLMVIPIRYNAKWTETANRERALMQYDGREKPVPYAGEMTSLTQGWSGTIFDPGTEGRDTLEFRRLREIVQAKEPTHVVRDPWGQRVYGVITNYSSALEEPGVRSVSFELQQAEA